MHHLIFISKKSWRDVTIQFQDLLNDTVAKIETDSQKDRRMD